MARSSAIGFAILTSQRRIISINSAFLNEVLPAPSVAHSSFERFRRCEHYRPQVWKGLRPGVFLAEVGALFARYRTGQEKGDGSSVDMSMHWGTPSALRDAIRQECGARVVTRGSEPTRVGPPTQPTAEIPTRVVTHGLG
jgi:hypothetical protein